MLSCLAEHFQRETGRAPAIASTKRLSSAGGFFEAPDDFKPHGVIVLAARLRAPLWHIRSPAAAECDHLSPVMGQRDGSICIELVRVVAATWESRRTICLELAHFGPI